MKFRDMAKEMLRNPSKEWEQFNRHVDATLTRHHVESNDWRCEGCRDDICLAEFYMIHDELWRKVRGGKGSMCIACVEKRLGRKLSRDDFKPAGRDGINSPSFKHVGYPKTKRLLDRLQARR